MFIQLDNISKRFGNTVIARNLSLTIESGEKWHISGSNGKGKSSLMQILAAYSSPDLGQVIYKSSNQKDLKPDEVFAYISISTPYTDLIYDYTLQEQIEFHFQFKKSLVNPDVLTSWLERAKLGAFRNRPLGLFSSGMKQKVKLILTLLSDSQCIFLDEPCSNLDQDGKEFYKELVNFRMGYPSTWIICSNNQPEEHFFCNRTLDLDQL